MKQLLRPTPKLPQQNVQPSQKPEDNNDRLTPKRSLKKWIYLGLGIVTCITIIWALQPKPIAVDMARVERGELKVTVNAEGKTRVRDRYTISADVAGRLERVQFKEGDPVKAGSIVARIDPISVNTAIQQAQALASRTRWRSYQTPQSSHPRPSPNPHSRRPCQPTPNRSQSCRGSSRPRASPTRSPTRPRFSHQWGDRP
jgi:hypothetical protein